MKELLEQNGYTVIPVEEQMVPDGNFSTLKSPNPEESTAFEYAIALGKKENADILIATDPDADRMGIAAKNKEGEYVLLTGNQTGAILLDYLAKYKHTEKQRVVYNTIVTSNLAKAICERHGIELVQTLTGFKFIGEQAALIEGTDKEFFFGYEESYGYVLKVGKRNGFPDGFFLRHSDGSCRQGCLKIIKGRFVAYNELVCHCSFLSPPLLNGEQGGCGCLAFAPRQQRTEAKAI